MKGLRVVLALIGVIAASALGSEAQAQAPDAALAQRIARLERDLSREESLRTAKQLQIAYAHYIEFGLWNEITDLFADDGELVIGDESYRGHPAILAHLTQDFGHGRLGLLPGGVSTRMQLTPVMNLSPDGKSAKGRWHEVSMLGQLGGEANWQGGISENDYVIENGRWKIARLHLYPMYAGTYETGWFNVEDDLPIVPFHYTPDVAGVPIPAAIGPLPAGPASEEEARKRLGAVEARLERLAAEDAVFRLQNIYGYYVDQKMWTDVTDLFTADGTREIVGSGVWQGEQGIRKSFGDKASNGLLHGESNVTQQLEIQVTVSPDAREAWARGFELGMLGQNHVSATWTKAIFENRYVKDGGVWKIAQMRIFPTMRTDYYQGWAKSQMPEPEPAVGYLPAFASAIDLPRDRAWIPAFNRPNPVTGEPVEYPRDTLVVGEDPLARAAAVYPFAFQPSTGPMTAGYVAELERQLRVVSARIGTENVSHAFGYYLDDFNWDGASALFARTGRRGKYQIGFYVTPERIREVEMRMYGPPKTPRTSIQVHLRVQPVIEIGDEGMTSKLRTRLFSFGSNNERPGSFGLAVYPNDKMVMQDGIWKFQHQSIDEFYVNSQGYKNGWAKVDEPKPWTPDAEPTMMDRIRVSYPPDVLQSEMGIRGVGFSWGPGLINFPDVKPMWFYYVNPVSGRVPPNYCPDHSTCYQDKPLFVDQEPTPAPGK